MSMFPPNMSFTLLPSEIRQYILKFVPSTSLNEYACVNQQCCADVKDKILPVRSELLPKAILYRTSVNLIQRMLNYCDSSIIGAPSLPSTASQHHSHHHHNRPENMYKVHRWIDQSLWMAVGLGHDEMIPYLLNSYRQILRKQQHQNSNVIDDDKINKMSPPVCCILNDDSGFYRIKNIATIYELLTYPSVSQMCQLVKDSSLMYAIYFGDLELTRILIEAGANWKKSNDLNTLSVVKSCILYDRLDILTYLIDTFGRDECLSHDPSLVANYIAEASSMDMTKYLMSLYDSDTSPHILQLLNTAAVVVACRLSDVLFARTLLQHGILWDTTWDDMSYSNRVLEEAIAAGVPELIQLVLEAQEDQFILCGYQVRDAHNVESLHILVTYAVDRNQYDDQFHDDVLFAACLIGDIEFVQRVLQMGMSVCIHSHCILAIYFSKCTTFFLHSLALYSPPRVCWLCVYLLFSKCTTSFLALARSVQHFFSSLCSIT